MEDVNSREAENFILMLEYLKSATEYGISPNMTEYLTQILDSAINFQSYLIHTAEFPEIHRLTINRRILGSNKRIHKVSHLKYPPKEFVKSYGRCNLPGQSVLYASHGSLMIYSEMKPSLGDLVTTSIWNTRNNDNLTFSPIFKNQPPNDILNLNSFEFNKAFNNEMNKFPQNQRKMIDEMTQFIADAFSKRFNHNSNNTDYLISAYFADIMLNKYHTGEIEAILYPSVQQSLSFENLAIKPEVFDSKYILSEVYESIVVQVPSPTGNGHFSEGILDSKQFDFDNDLIVWGKTNRTEEEMIYYSSLGYDFD